MTEDSDRKHSKTKKYHREYMRKYMANMPKERKEEVRQRKNARRRERYRNEVEYREKHKKEVHDRYLKDPKIRKKERLKKYGLTVEQHEAMIEDQSGKCAICWKRKKLSVDHCHKEGHVRGLLCEACNFGLGKFKDDPKLLRRAIEYLNTPPKKVEMILPSWLRGYKDANTQ